MSKNKLHKLYLFILVIWFITPITLLIFNDSLHTVFVAGVEPEVQPKEVKWSDGSWQKQIENELFEKSNFKNIMIRVRNQYQYSLFHKINANQIYEYEHYYYRFYINKYREDLYVNSDKKNQKILSDLIEFKSLLRKDCPIISIIAPSKARLFPEYLPSRNITKTNHTNYDFFKNGMRKNGITCIDFNDYFVKNKGNFDAAIIAKGGIHWTYYATSIAMDSVIRVIESIKGTKYNHFSTTLSDCNGFNVDDQDISVLTNLIIKKRDYNIKHTEFSQKGIPQKKINALIIGDSFFFTIENSDLRNLIFTENSDYLYYFGETHDNNQVITPIDIDKIKKQLNEVDCVIFLNDLVNMENFTFGFPKKMIEVLKKDSLQK